MRIRLDAKEFSITRNCQLKLHQINQKSGKAKSESEGGRIIYVRRHRIIHKMQDNHLSLNASSDCCEGIGVYLS